MTMNFTTLALNLLVAERLNHRSFFASKITEALENIKDNSEKDKQIKKDFIAIIDHCVEDPSGKFRDMFFHYSQYYTQKMAGDQGDLRPAA